MRNLLCIPPSTWVFAPNTAKLLDILNHSEYVSSYGLMRSMSEE
jgi:hypothetical protein